MHCSCCTVYSKTLWIKCARYLANMIWYYWFQDSIITHSGPIWLDSSQWIHWKAQTSNHRVTNPELHYTAVVFLNHPFLPGTSRYSWGAGQTRVCWRKNRKGFREPTGCWWHRRPTEPWGGTSTNGTKTCTNNKNKLAHTSQGFCNNNNNKKSITKYYCYMYKGYCRAGVGNSGLWRPVSWRVYLQP